MKEIESISIKELENKALTKNKLKSDILLSAKIKFDDSMFKHPSRMDAFAAIFCVSGEAEVQINLKKRTRKQSVNKEQVKIRQPTFCKDKI